MPAFNTPLNEMLNVFIFYQLSEEKSPQNILYRYSSPLSYLSSDLSLYIFNKIHCILLFQARCRYRIKYFHSYMYIRLKYPALFGKAVLSTVQSDRQNWLLFTNGQIKSTDCKTVYFTGSGTSPFRKKDNGYFSIQVVLTLFKYT